MAVCRWITLGIIALASLASLSAQPARALDQAQSPAPAAVNADPHAGLPGAAQIQARVELYAHQDRSAFERDIRLDQFRLLAVEHLDQLKIIDSWARQSLFDIRHRQSFDGMDSVYLALDMAIRPEAWLNRNIIYVESVPIREELGVFAGGAAEARRIRQQALVSPVFLLRRDVMQRLNELEDDARFKKSVDKVYTALDTFLSLDTSLAMLPPTADHREAPWACPSDIVMADQPGTRAATAAASPAVPAAADPAAPYLSDQRLRIRLAYLTLVEGWRNNDVQLANQGLGQLAGLAPAIDAPAYPSATKRQIELWYNRTYSGTLVAFAYFAAMVLFLLVAVGASTRTGKVRRFATTFFAIALAFHILAMGVRWWLNGRIPIQNQFESVMGSACIGCVIGFLLELWRRNGIFGTAFSFVGFLATTVLLAAPYVFGTDLGAAPGRVAGILNTGWLYIHVNVVIASYALILASAAIAAVFLTIRYLSRDPENPPSPDHELEVAAIPNDGGGGGIVATAPRVAVAPAADRRAGHRRADLLNALDQAHMVVLQLGMWLLGAGIICGAVWADQSWGRPWGWDPKETFALVTWIVYLIIVHVRLVTKTKSDVTAWLSLGGCAVMLFNWIGVNFFLVGLHSYA